MPILKVIWVALVLCVLIYAALLWRMTVAWGETEARSVEQLTAHPFVLVLALMALISVAMAFTIPNMMMRGSALTPEVIRVRSIVQWALVETVAIYGLVGAIIVQDARVFIAFGSVAILGFLLTFPSAERTSNPL